MIKDPKINLSDKNTKSTVAPVKFGQQLRPARFNICLEHSFSPRIFQSSNNPAMRNVVKKCLRPRSIALVILAGILSYLHTIVVEEESVDRHTEQTFSELFLVDSEEGGSFTLPETPVGKAPAAPERGTALLHTKYIEDGANAVGSISETSTDRENTDHSASVVVPSLNPPGSSAIASPFGELKLHIVVSSDCSSYQRWQVLTQFHSAHAVGQMGRLSWLLAGCSDSETMLTQTTVLKHFPDPGRRPLLHFCPDFSDMSRYGGPFADGTKKRTFRNRRGEVRPSPYGNKYRFNNKPNSLHHWASNGNDLELDEVVVLVDPDFMFMAPLVLHSHREETRTSRRKSGPGSVSIGPGAPAAQNYGLGDQWLSFNLTKICGEGTPCTQVTSKEVYEFYSAGPPYIIHAVDVEPFSREWARLVPPTYDQYPMLYAEMFAYSMAAAQLGLKHTLISGLMTGMPW